MFSRVFKPAVLAMAIITAFAFAAPGQAEAGSRHRDRALVAGAVGVTAGVLLGAALAQPRYAAPVYSAPVYADPDPYYEPEVVYVERPRRHYRYEQRRYYQRPAYREVYSDYAPEPWSPDWYAYCASKYRSFDPDTGTFQPYYGPRQVCR